MPGDDFTFTRLPAKKEDVALLDLPRKIDEAEVDVLEKAAVGFNRMSRSRHLRGEIAQLRITFDDGWELQSLNLGVIVDQSGDPLPQPARCALQLAQHGLDYRNERGGLIRVEKSIKMIISQEILSTT